MGEKELMKILVTSHGQLAVGIMNTLEMIAGKFDDVIALPFTEEMGIDNFTEKMNKILQIKDQSEEWLIITDMMGGTPFNVASTFSYQNESIRVLYGLNLPLLTEVVMNKSNKDLKQMISYLETLFNDMIGVSPI